MKPLIVGLGHRARHGKDTVAQFFIGLEPELLIQRFAFADDLYAYCRIEYGMTKKNAPLLQKVGVEMREKRHKDIWVRSVDTKIKEADPVIAIVTDVRFKNEASWVKANGGLLVRVERLNADGSRYVAADRDPNHQSEIELADYPWDYTIRASCRNDLTAKASQLFYDIILPASQV